MHKFFIMKIERFLSAIILSFVIITVIVSCGGSRQYNTDFQGLVSSDSSMVEFARGFTIEKHGKVVLLSVFNPWQGAQNVIFRYVLCPKDIEIPVEYSQYTVIRTPVERVICLATTHVAMLSVLGQTESIKALSGVSFVSDTSVRKAIEQGIITDVGYGGGLNYEKIISLNPDVIFAYGVDEGLTGSMARLAGLGQKIVFNAEYLEQTPLGKAEWIKFLSAFYDCIERATVIFDEIRDDYLSHSSLVKGIEHKPKILCGLPWQGVWRIPGGETWMSAMIADAGGDYIWKDNPSRESIPINIETIVYQGGAADFWINLDAARSLDEIKSLDERLSQIKPFQTGAVYNNNARTGATAGNDFFESGVVNPHIILKDMIRIFHPDLLPEHNMFYYKKLE